MCLFPAEINIPVFSPHRTSHWYWMATFQLITPQDSDLWQALGQPERVSSVWSGLQDLDGWMMLQLFNCKSRWSFTALQIALPMSRDSAAMCTTRTTVTEHQSVEHGRVRWMSLPKTFEQNERRVILFSIAGYLKLSFCKLGNIILKLPTSYTLK